ncbi:MAG: BamA/TamA family outer membrane protein [Elusimicrobia bacterium]|nr:BamA/TamA family outer membrane protein [Elusimicrobiota bacterium]
MIGQIRIDRLNVFDPRVRGEDLWMFRMANNIHFMTKEQVLSRELLLSPGEPWDELKALQSERNIRAMRIFRRADLRPVPGPDGKLDLHLTTQDSWTTNLQFSLGTEGGEEFLSYGVSENNLFGYDKKLGFLHSKVGNRTRDELRYLDPRFLGSRFRFSPFYAKTNEGTSFGTGLLRPFFALDTKLAVVSAWNRTIDEDILYQRAEEITRFVHRSRVATGSYGVRLPWDRFFVQRAEMGWYSQKDNFERNEDTVGALPMDREMSGPVIGYSWVQPRYIKESYVDRMERVEDYNLGNELQLMGGHMGRNLGSDQDRWIFSAFEQQGLRLAPGRFALGQVGASGRMAGRRSENALFFASLNLFWKVERGLAQTWVAHLEGSRGVRLDGENQIVLGGDTGLRGYKNNSFAGSEAALFNLENRFFLPEEYFHLFRFGGAVFFDSGAVGDKHSPIEWKKVRSDVGAGLRVSSTRSQTGAVVRMDLAYALNDGPGRSRWVVSIRGRQAFHIFSSASSRVRQSPSTRLPGLEPPALGRD